MISPKFGYEYSIEQSKLFEGLSKLFRLDTNDSEPASITVSKVEQAVEMICMIQQLEVASKSRSDVISDFLWNSESISIAAPEVAVSLPWKKWLLERKPHTDLKQWNAYRALLQQRGWSRQVINGLDLESDRVVDFLGDPHSADPFRRKGLLIGEVQSGKTANYLAMANKAIDYGYRLVIILGGHTEELRRQTQRRTDTDLIGTNSEFLTAHLDKRKAGELREVGIGLLESKLEAICFTGVQNDFNITRARDGRWRPGAIPTVAVLKKNLNILRNLNEFLLGMAADDGAFEFPILIIDDEADWASINTKTEEDPTAVSHAIASLLDRSKRSCYLGITATPFANILIDHERSQELFPNDFIISLNSPSNYYGVEAYAEDESEHVLTDVEDMLKILPYSHKSRHRIHEVPESLRDAIATFVVSSAMRRIKAGKTVASSMLINVSRFIAVQEQVSELVDEYINELANSVRAELSLDRETYVSEELNRLHRVFTDVLKQAPEDWRVVANEVTDLIDEVLVELMNGRTIKERAKRLEQMHREVREAHLKLPTIFVGGNVLSRGLTLEGLQTSYFVRRTGAADTLLQTGRWFGYRNGYHDLVRIWMSEESSDRFRYTAELSQDIRHQIRRMGDRDMTPEQFGLRMSMHPEAFQITAANKRKSAEVRQAVRLHGETYESFFMSDRVSDLERNLSAAVELAKGLDGEAEKQSRLKHNIFRNVERDKIVKFFDSFAGFSDEPIFGEGGGYQCQLRGALEDLPGADEWDVAFLSGSDQRRYPYAEGNEVNFSLRNKIDRASDHGYYRFANRRVATGGNLLQVVPSHVASKLIEGTEKTPSEALICSNLERPLLMVFTVVTDDTAKFEVSAELPIVAVKVAFPPLNSFEEEDSYYRKHAKKFVVNSVWRALNSYEDEQVDEDENGETF